MEEQKRAIILADDHYNGLGLIRSLGKAGADVFLLLTSERKPYISKSRYVKQYFILGKNDEKILACMNGWACTCTRGTRLPPTPSTGNPPSALT